MNNTVNNDLTLMHQCFAVNSKQGDIQHGRIHLPVSPNCNISCKFCRRETGVNDVRPGVAAKILTPEEAVKIVGRALRLCPEITVAGIAGPGDTLCTGHALDTFRLIKREFPFLIKCMSTNGLELLNRADEIIDVGIDSLTVTVNAVDPDILAQIVNCADPELLIKNQLDGIKKVTDAGITVKVNTVMITEINAAHVPEVAKAVADAGAVIYNIIPLIPQHELAWCSEPDCDLRKSVREQAERYIQVFRHCKRCRADAAGVPGGKDVSGSLYGEGLKAENTFSHG